MLPLSDVLVIDKSALACTETPIVKRLLFLLGSLTALLTVA